MPNFNFGGGQRGTMIANSSEYVVPHFGGKSGSAIFNQNMVAEMGLPAGARKISAAGGYIPNFAKAAQMINQGPNSKYVMLTGQRAMGKNLKSKIVYTGMPTGQKETVEGKRRYSLKADGFEGASEKINVPIYKLPSVGETPTKGKKVMDIKQYIGTLKVAAFRQALRQARALSGGKMPKPVKRTKIKEKINEGALTGFAGTIYELTLATLLTDEEFTKYADTTDVSNFDLSLKGQKKLLDIYGISGSPDYGEVKGLDSAGNIKSAGAKIYRVASLGKAPQKQKLIGKKLNHVDAVKLGLKPKGSRGGAYIIKASDSRVFNRLEPYGTDHARIRIGAGARGYIPNFANPLEDAVGRERAAGLPLSQIRINQDSRLRNAGNPEGLAVTNMRDEPTGRVPNFAQYIPGRPPMPAPAGGAAPAPTPTSPKSSRDLLGPIFAVTAAMSALSGATSGAAEGTGKFINELSKGLSTLATIAFAGTAIKGFTNDLAASDSTRKAAMGKFLGGLTVVAASVGAGIAAFNTINKIIYQNSDASKINTDNLNRLSDAAKNASRSLNDLGDLEKGVIEREAKLEAGTAQFTDETIALNPRSRLRKSLNPFAKEGAQIRSRNREGDIVIGGSPRAKAFELRGTGAGGKFEDKELQKTIDIMFRDAAVNQIPPSEVRELLRKAAVGGETVERRSGVGKDDAFQQEILEPEEVDNALKEFIRMLTSADEAFTKEQKEFRTLLRESGYGADSLKSLLSNLSEGSASFLPEASLSALRRAGGEEFSGAGLNLKLAEKEKIIKEEIKRIETEIASIGAEKEREKLELTKALLKASLDKRMIELTNTSELESQIKRGKELGTLTKEELRVLETHKFTVEQNNKLLKLRFNLIKAGIEKLKGLTATEEQRLTLQGELSKLTANQLLDADKIKEVLVKVFGLTEITAAAAGEMAQNMVDVQVANDAAVVSANAFESSTRKSADNTARIKENLGTVSAFLRFQANQEAFDTTLTSNVDIAKLEDRKRRIETNIDRGGLAPNRRDELLKQIRGINLDVATERAAQSEAGLLRDARTFKLPTTMEGREDAEQLLAQAETTTAAFAIIRSSLTGLSDAESHAARTRFQALKNNTDATRQQTNATLQQTEAELKLVSARVKTINNLDEQARQLREVGLTGEARVAKRGADAVLGGRRDIEPALLQRVAQMKTSAWDRFLDSPDFSTLHQVDALNESLKDAALNFKNTMSDAMVDSIIQGGNLGDILRSAATNFFTMLSKAYMQNAVDRIVGSGGGLLSALFGKKNSGGLITGGSGNRDDVPTLLTGGEFVVRKGAVEKYGTQFFEGLNTGRVGQMQRGGLFTPGTYGQGSITGSQNLLDFATQSYTGGQFDQISEGAGFGSASLEPQSAALTMFGRRNSPLFQREQQSKQEAFGLYTRQIQYEEQIKKQNKEDRKQFRNSILAAAGSAALSYGIDYLAKKLPKTPKPLGEDIQPRGLSERPPPPPRRDGGASQVLTNNNYSPPPMQITAGWRPAAAPSVPLPPDTFESDTVDLDLPDRALQDILHTHPTDGSPFRNNRSAPNRGGGDGWAAGGYISPTAGVDTVPSMLSGGEFVMNAAATQRMGRGNLAALNSGGGGEGGDGAIVAAINNLGDELGRNGESVINITVNSDGTQTQDSNGGEEDQNLAARLGDSVRQIIAEEQRLGGSLRRV